MFVSIVPVMEHLPSGILLLLAGEVIICLATFLYIGSSLGCGLIIPAFVSNTV